MEKIKVKRKLGDILVETGQISADQLHEALLIQASSRKKLGEVLIDLKYVTESQIIFTLSEQLHLEIVELEKYAISADIARMIPKEVAKKYNLIPIAEIDNKIFVAMSDPLNVFAIDDVRFITHKEIQICISKSESINKAIELNYNKQASDRAIEDLKKEYKTNSDDKSDVSNLEDIQNAPVVRLTNSILTQAISLKASDIHVEPFEESVYVRYRIDGALTDNMTIPQKIYSAVSTRIKIMAGMNIAEKRLPQDGRIEMEVGGLGFDFRVSSLPTVYGEKIVIRILDRSSFLFSREMLGFTKKENLLIEKIVNTPYGIILITGPTGSGKTTTLYSILREMNTVDRNIVTVEDPVEYMLHRINQVQVNAKAGLTFASGLRSILRQDPDVIMIGEIRDEETAQIAVRAAITGHIVLSTLHTNDAPSAVTRLSDMGIESYLVAEATVGIIAQRLVRKLCPSCKEKYSPVEWEKNILKDEEVQFLYRPIGCPTCNGTGFKGRKAIHEVMLIDKEIRNDIEAKFTADNIRDTAIKNGMITLFENCRQLCLKGETSMGELMRSVYARD